MKLAAAWFLIAASLLVAVVFQPPAQLICAVNEHDFLVEGWDRLQEWERHAAAARPGYEISARPGTVYCTWHGNEIPTPGALLYVRRIDVVPPASHF